MKPKRAINVGDKVQYRIGANLWDGKVISNHPTASEVFLVKWADSHAGDYVHRKQITKVIRKKKKEKREPRTVWVREFNGTLQLSQVFPLPCPEDMSLRCVEFREVIKGEEE